MSTEQLTDVGYFDGTGSSPAFDPGLKVPCPVCHASLEQEPRCTVSLMAMEHPTKSYFFRAHKRCWETCGRDRQSDIESEIIDAAIRPVA